MSVIGATVLGCSFNADVCRNDDDCPDGTRCVAISAVAAACVSEASDAGDMDVGDPAHDVGRADAGPFGRDG